MFGKQGKTGENSCKKNVINCYNVLVRMLV